MNPSAYSILADRYVPLRRPPSRDHSPLSTSTPHRDQDDNQSSYSQWLGQQHSRYLSFSKKQSTADSLSLKDSLTSHIDSIRQIKLNLNLVNRVQAYFVMEAPSVEDDFYGKFIDWSAKETVCVGIRSECCFLHKDKSISTVDLLRRPADYKLTSVKFNREGSLVFVGGSNGEIAIYDI